MRIHLTPARMLAMGAILSLGLTTSLAHATPGADRQFDRNIQAVDTGLLEPGTRALLDTYRTERSTREARQVSRQALPGRSATPCTWDDRYRVLAGLETPSEVIFARALVTNKGRGSVDLGHDRFELHADGACPDAVDNGPASFWITWYQNHQAMEPAAVSSIEEARRLYAASAADSSMKMVMRFDGEFRNGQPHGRFRLIQTNHTPEMQGMRGGSVAAHALGYADFEDGERVRVLIVTEMGHGATLAYLEQPHGDEHQLNYWVMHGAGMHMGDHYPTNAAGEIDGLFVRLRSNESPPEISACVRGNLPAERSACD
ncbi:MULTISPECIES: hypothetical protein [unclassified Thioalkalivibrio]|uniref:hypothetical protein n=1 Tax=unclassified Thioalkalivibrio TaxID=2621013 RepID=UPI00037D66EE|nr:MULTISPECIES: hypothetical protein [unclassified Thioalkalivibrio]